MVNNILGVTGSNLAMTIGSIGTLYFTIKTYKERTKADKSGIGIKEITAEGMAEIRNDSKIDTTIKVEKYVIDDGGNDKISSESIADFLSSKNKKEFIKEKIKDTNGVEIVPEQILGIEESLNFHIHDAPLDETFVVLLTVKLTSGDKERFYVYYHANGEKIGGSNLISDRNKKNLQPYDMWVKAYSF